jgi:phosphatidyl-myo-inositol alpha-mannosyltransferase
VTNPFNWPQLRRGTERFVNEAAEFFASRGHKVTVVSCHPGSRTVQHRRGYETICYRHLWYPVMGKLGVWQNHTFFFTALYRLLTHRYDAVLCCSFTDTVAANLARNVRHAPVAFFLNGIPQGVQRYRRLSSNGRVWNSAIRNANGLIVLSEFQREYVKRRTGIEGTVLSVPVDIRRFGLSSQREPLPFIVCAAALDEPRKGGQVLARAFNLLKRTHPDAKLLVASHTGAATQVKLRGHISPEWRRDIEFRSDIGSDELPGHFGRAWVSVLPSMFEPYGMVIMESLATGTPVVGASHGAIPELIEDRRVGRLFSPEGQENEATNAEGLADALADALDMSRDPVTRIRCREHAERYSWERLGPKWEAFMQHLTGGPE